ncbi:MAG: hypothetical protein R3F61_38540 [Myxococcota bacterium]
MSRHSILYALVVCSGCSGALATEKSESFPSLIEVESGSYVALFGITMGVDAASRDLRAELEMNVGGLLEEGVAVQASFTTPTLEPIPTTEPSAHTGAVAIQFEPAFATCDGPAYTERDDGGCDIAVLGTVTLGASGTPRVGFIGRVFETDTWMGTEAAIRIDLEVEEIRPE